MAKYYYKSPLGREAIKLRTVNVIEMCNGEFQQSWSFADNPEGNKRAVNKFRRLVQEHQKVPGKPFDPIDVEEMDHYLDDGVYDDNQGYQVLITHSL